MIGEAFVLAGGRSSRMGRPKALMELAGKTFMERILETLSADIPRVFIVGDPPEPERFSDWEVVPDAIPGHGVLSGLHAGLSACRGAWAFCAACDVPALDPLVPQILWEESDGLHDAVIPHALKFPQPTLALYRASIAEGMPKYLERTVETKPGRLLHGYLDRIRVQWVDEGRFFGRGVSPLSFHNTNDEEDYQALLAGWERLRRNDETG